MKLFKLIFVWVVGLFATQQPTDLFTGNVPNYFDDVATGDVIEPMSLTYGDVEEEMAQGAPLSAAIKTAVATSGTEQQKRNAALPGVGLMGAKLSPFYPQGAKVEQPGTNRTVSGNLVKFNVDESPVRNPFLSVSGMVQGNANPAVAVSVAFANAQRPAGCTLFSAPLLFVTISSSQLNARVGQKYDIEWSGVSRDGAALSEDVWAVRRESAAAMKFTIIPYIRQKDSIVPVACAFGTLGGVEKTLTVTVTGMPDTETMSVLVPGLDSKEYEAFLKTFGLSLGS